MFEIYLADTYSTVFSGIDFFVSKPMVFAKCVFPNPPDPYINKGLKEVPPGFEACTSIQAILLIYYIHLPQMYQKYKKGSVVD